MVSALNGRRKTAKSAALPEATLKAQCSFHSGFPPPSNSLPPGEGEIFISPSPLMGEGRGEGEF